MEQKKPSRIRSAFIGLRLLPEEKERMVVFARKHNMSLSKFLVEAALRGIAENEGAER